VVTGKKRGESEEIVKIGLKEWFIKVSKGNTNIIVSLLW